MKTNTHIMMDQMRGIAGSGPKLGSALGADWDAMRTNVQLRGNFPRYLEMKIRAFCLMHNITVPEEAFLSAKQRKAMQPSDDEAAA